MALGKFAVYRPPAGLKFYLGVLIRPDNSVQGLAFATEHEARRFVEQAAKEPAAMAEKKRKKGGSGAKRS